MYPTTTDLLDALPDARTARLAGIYLYRWKAAGILRPVVDYAATRGDRRRGSSWPDWTPRMIALAIAELAGHHEPLPRRGPREVLVDVAGALEVDPDAVFVTITPDGNVETHDDADTVAALCIATGNVVIVAIPT
jgi:hypothetical protein